jgi:hypothetical protein
MGLSQKAEVFKKQELTFLTPHNMHYNTCNVIGML